MTTINHAFKLLTDKDIHKRDIMILCEYLQTEFRKEFQFIPDDGIFTSNLCECCDERHMNGGILINNWTGKKKNMIKKIRFVFREACTTWGTVDIDDWNSSNELICKKNTAFTSYVFTDNDAPEWSKDEMKKMEKCLNKIGIRVMANT